MNELARVTIDTPDRRLDIAAPAGVPLADLMRVLVRAGGERLAERGAATGWVVRCADGTPLSGAESLQDQGVRDGDLLHLVPADATWPELEFDDIADAIAATRRDGASWSPEATRRTSAAAGVAVALIALIAIVRDGPHSTTGLVAAALAAVLFGAGILMSRVLGDGRTGELMASLAIPYAFVAGLLARDERPTAIDLLIACVVAALVAWFAAIGIGRSGAIFIASWLAAALGAVGAVLDRVTTPVDAAAIIISVVALGAGVVPAAAVRLGGLGHWRVDGALAPAVTRTDTAITGLSGGIAFVATAAATVLAFSDLAWPRLLALAGLVALATRARAYGSVRQRLAALAGAVGIALPLAAAMIWTGLPPLPTVALLAVAGSFAIIMRTAGRTPSRTIAWIEALSLLSILPLLSAATNLYTRARALH
jgi:ESX secretion system protein EccD